MNWNNRGFAISGVLYSLLIIFVTLFLGMLTMMASSKFSFDKIKKEITGKLSAKVLNPYITSEHPCIHNTATFCPTKTDTPVTVIVQLNASTTGKFYVIGDTGTKLTLIMDRNIGNQVAWISSSDYTTAGGTNWGTNGNNNKGPLTALTYLESQTSGWTNIPTMNYTLSDDGGGTKYQPITRINVRARMLTKTEASTFDCTTSSNSCKSFLYDNLYSDTNTSLAYGYWLSSAYSDSRDNAWLIHYFGYVGSSFVNSVSDCGVRPVIELYKTM